MIEKVDFIFESLLSTVRSKAISVFRDLVIFSPSRYSNMSFVFHDFLSPLLGSIAPPAGPGSEGLSPLRRGRGDGSYQLIKLLDFIRNIGGIFLMKSKSLIS